MSDELLPCPFCGGKACIEQHERGRWLAFCADVYGGCGADGWYEDTPEQAIEAWNRRATLPMSAAPTIPDEVREALRRSLQRSRNRMLEVNAMGWYKDSTPTDNEIARIDAALAWLDAQRGEATP